MHFRSYPRAITTPIAALKAAVISAEYLAGVGAMLLCLAKMLSADKTGQTLDLGGNPAKLFWRGKYLQRPQRVVSRTFNTLR